jgi:hypothetical protein
MYRDTITYATKQDKKVFAKTMLMNSDTHVHEIKNIVISKQADFYGVVNRETLALHCFDTEKQSIDFVLDYFGWVGTIQSEVIFS